MLAWYTQQFISLALFQFAGHSCSWQNLFASDALLQENQGGFKDKLINMTPNNAITHKNGDQVVFISI